MVITNETACFNIEEMALLSTNRLELTSARLPSVIIQLYVLVILVILLAMLTLC